MTNRGVCADEIQGAVVIKSGDLALSTERSRGEIRFFSNKSSLCKPKTTRTLSIRRGGLWPSLKPYSCHNFSKSLRGHPGICGNPQTAIKTVETRGIK